MAVVFDLHNFSLKLIPDFYSSSSLIGVWRIINPKGFENL